MVAICAYSPRMGLGVRRWWVAGAVVLSGTVGTGHGAIAQDAPTPSTSTTTTLGGASTTTTAPTSITPTTEVMGPPDLTVTVSYDCPVSAGPGVPVPGLSVAIVNRGGPAVVDIVVDGVTAPQAMGIEVPQSYLGIPQQFSVPLPEGEPGVSVGVDAVESGTGRVLAVVGIDHRPQCEGQHGGFLAPPATPTRGTATYTG